MKVSRDEKYNNEIFKRCHCGCPRVCALHHCKYSRTTNLLFWPQHRCQACFYGLVNHKRWLVPSLAGKGTARMDDLNIMVSLSPSPFQAWEHCKNVFKGIRQKWGDCCTQDRQSVRRWRLQSLQEVRVEQSGWESWGLNCCLMRWGSGTTTTLPFLQEKAGAVTALYVGLSLEAFRQALTMKPEFISL